MSKKTSMVKRFDVYFNEHDRREDNNAIVFAQSKTVARKIIKDVYPEACNIDIVVMSDEVFYEIDLKDKELAAAQRDGCYVYDSGT